MIAISIKTPAEVKVMAEGGRKLARVRDGLAAAVKPGMTPLQLDQLADKLIEKEEAGASFKMVPGYHNATCICVNEEVVHGIPTAKRKFAEGDIVGIDVGIFYKGFHTDTATTVRVGSKLSPKTARRSRRSTIKIV